MNCDSRARQGTAVSDDVFYDRLLCISTTNDNPHKTQTRPKSTVGYYN
jgi:hypothetical protein